MCIPYFLCSLIFRCNYGMLRFCEYANLWLNILILWFLRINYDLTHVPRLSMSCFSEPGFVNIIFPAHSHFVHMTWFDSDPMVLIDGNILSHFRCNDNSSRIYVVDLFRIYLFLYVYDKRLTSVIPIINHLWIVELVLYHFGRKSSREQRAEFGLLFKVL